MDPLAGEGDEGEDQPGEGLSYRTR